MNIEKTIASLSTLSVDERLLIVQRLWDSIPPESEVTVSAKQQEELKRRVAAHDRDPDSAISRGELERRLKENR